MSCIFVVVNSKNIAEKWFIEPGHITTTGKYNAFKLHSQILPTGYGGLMFHSRAVVTASDGTFEDTMKVLWCYCDEGYLYIQYM